ncbi:replication protein [Paenibacillus elgii]|uniref:replication protein n=1 Tax=Paenibacillus elgii TaxID=189691 RepID=UPI00203BAA6D|nr:replication protein [Paenibacillus elgii]MCM3272591.1 replication protein [Paenibacillus elgii]
MSGPQLEDGYTRVANEILEQLPRHKFNGTQLRIILVIWRYTYGFGRKESEFSLSYLSEATGISKRQIEREIDALIMRKVVLVVSEATGRRSRILRFNKHYHEWISVESTKKTTLRRVDELDDPESTKKTTLMLRRVDELDDQQRKYLKKELKKGTCDMEKQKNKFLDTVFLTGDEYARLINDFGKDTVDLYIEKLDEWQTNHPRRTKKDHNKTIRVWIRDDEAKRTQRSSKQKKHDEQMAILNQFYQEGRADEEDGNGTSVGRNQNCLPPL